MHGRYHAEWNTKGIVRDDESRGKETKLNDSESMYPENGSGTGTLPTALADARGPEALSCGSVRVWRGILNVIDATKDLKDDQRTIAHGQRRPHLVCSIQHSNDYTHNPHISIDLDFDMLILVAY